MSIKSIKVSSVIVEATTGSVVGDCLREAAIYSLEHEVDVVLKHNSKDYKLRYDGVMDHLISDARIKLE